MYFFALFPEANFLIVFPLFDGLDHFVFDDAHEFVGLEHVCEIVLGLFSGDVFRLEIFESHLSVFES